MFEHERKRWHEELEDPERAFPQFVSWAKPLIGNVNDMKLNFPEIALHVPTILLPAKDVKLETWSVIACDQYTSEPEYWDRVYAKMLAMPLRRFG